MNMTEEVRALVIEARALMGVTDPERLRAFQVRKAALLAETFEAGRIHGRREVIAEMAQEATTH